MKTTKKLLLLIFAVAMLISIFAMPACAASTTNQTGGTAGTWNYTLVNGKATNVYCSSALSGAVTIPSALNGYPVVSIGSGMSNPVFKSENKTITSIVIPNTVTTINSSAFRKCINLKSITIPNSVQSIENHVFYACENLTSVTIPDSVTSIGFNAFTYCIKLTSLTIPASVTSMGQNAISAVNSNICINVVAGSYAEAWVRNQGFTNIVYYADSSKLVEQATEVVSNVEAVKTQESVDEARALVAELPDSPEKTALLNRLDAVQQYIDAEIAYIAQVDEAETAVGIAETTKLQADVDYATLLINALREDDKLLLFMRVDAVQNYIDNVSIYEQAEKIITIAENTKTTADLNTAWEKISALPAGDIKDDYVMLLANIDSNYQNAVIKVEKAENYATNRDYIISADESTKTLTDYNVLKADLTQRVQKLKDDYNRAIAETEYYYNTDKATHYVIQSERNPANYNLNKAQEYINLLREDDPVRKDLQARLDAIKDKIALAELTKAIQSAEKAVANAEKYRTATYFNKAQNLVTDLPDIEEKQALQDRLDAIILK